MRGGARGPEERREPGCCIIPKKGQKNNKNKLLFFFFFGIFFLAQTEPRWLGCSDSAAFVSLSLSLSTHIWHRARRQSVMSPTQACRRRYRNRNRSDTCDDLSPSGFLFCVFFFRPSCLVLFFSFSELWLS